MKSSRWLITALIISIALNLLLVGVFIGQRVGEGRFEHFRWMTRELEPQTREQLRENMRAHIKASRQERQELRVAQQALHKAIAAEPYDRDRVAASLEQVRHASLALQETMHINMLEILADLGPEDRQRILRILSRPPHPPRMGPPREQNHPGKP